MKGYVYVLSNEAMPGLLKIGRSKAGGQHRGNQIYKGDTGTPLPFTLEFECLFDDCVEAEALVHERLQDRRINEAREFFRLDADEAIIAVLETRADYYDHVVAHYDEAALIYNTQLVADDDLRKELLPEDFRAILEEVSAEEIKPAYARIKSRRALVKTRFGEGAISEH